MALGPGTIVAPLAQASLPAGAGNIRTQGPIPDGTNLVVLSIAKINWPGTGELAGKFQISYSTDNGKTWIVLFPWDSFNDDPNDPNPLTWARSVPIIQGASRRILVEWEFFKPLTISGALTAYQATLA